MSPTTSGLASAIDLDPHSRFERNTIRTVIARTCHSRRATLPTSTCDCICCLTGWLHHAPSTSTASSGLLPNNAWTNQTPVPVDEVNAARLRARTKANKLTVWGVDRFPRMTDYVVPSGVRIADARSVRPRCTWRRARLSCMRGFCNFNAGTLGSSMVEGRISVKRCRGDGSDIGGGASIMGTLSGGGSEVISVGKGCLIGANAGIGISLGDGSVVEAGCYVTGGSKVSCPVARSSRARNCPAKTSCSAVTPRRAIEASDP